MTIYDRIGGDVALTAAVELFYTRVLTDDRISHFFAGIDMDRLKRHQHRFLAVVLGAPDATYPGKAMATAHARLVEDGLNDEHFNAVAEQLAATLKELAVGNDLIVQVLAIVESVRDDVLGRQTPATRRAMG